MAQGFRDERWRLETLEELSDMKSRLMGAAHDSFEEHEERIRGAPGDIDFDELDALNSEMDQEMAMLMSQLGLVKGEVGVCHGA